MSIFRFLSRFLHKDDVTPLTEKQRRRRELVALRRAPGYRKLTLREQRRLRMLELELG